MDNGPWDYDEAQDALRALQGDQSEDYEDEYWEFRRQEWRDNRQRYERNRQSRDRT